MQVEDAAREKEADEVAARPRAGAPIDRIAAEGGPQRGDKPQRLAHEIEADALYTAIAALVADADTRSGVRQLVGRTHVAVTKTVCRLNCLVVARDSRDLPTARPKQRGLTGVTLPYLVSSPRCLCHQRDSAVSDRLGALALVVQSAAPCPT
jgi:hypothetical protein